MDVCASLVWTLRRLGLNSGVRNLKITPNKNAPVSGRFFVWPARRDSNSRHPGSKPGALSS